MVIYVWLISYPKVHPSSSPLVSFSLLKMNLLHLLPLSSSLPGACVSHLHQYLHPHHHLRYHLLHHLLDNIIPNHLIFNSRKDMIKTVNMTPALIRKVVVPSRLYKRPPIISPTILAKLSKLFATPWTVPWCTVPARFESIDSTDGHIKPLPIANRIAAP